MTYNVFSGTLNPTHSLTHSIGSAIFARLTIVTDRQANRPTDRQTDHTTLSDNNRPHMAPIPIPTCDAA